MTKIERLDDNARETHPLAWVLCVHQLSVGSGPRLELDVLRLRVDVHVHEQQVLVCRR